MRFFLTLSAYIGIFCSAVLCGNVIVNHSPSNVRFGHGSALHLSNLDDVIAASLGYTPQNLIWSGLTVTTPFRYPKAAVVLGIRDGGVPIKLEGTSYNLKEDSSFKNTYDDLTSLIGNRAQRPINFMNVPVSDLVKDTTSSYTVPKPKVLDTTKDSKFLQQMEVLPNLADYVKPSSRLSHGGQDIVFVDVDSFASLVTKYGADSSQVKEASTILRGSIAQTIARVEKIYGDSVVVMTTLLSNDAEDNHVRKRRAIGDDPVTVDYNLGGVYDEDYPVIFNIVLLLGVVLTVALIAISMSLAFMDPGRDSIIYRMTNPRMKKDN